MNKRHVFYVGIVLLAAMALIGAPLTAMAHPPVSLLDANGGPVAAGSTTPYSPKQTCSLAACHSNPDPLISGPTHSYGGGTKMSVHTQGVIASDDKIYWQSYDVKSFDHGASVGRHSNQGRNEDYSNTFRTNYGLPFFTSSPGMFGKF